MTESIIGKEFGTPNTKIKEMELFAKIINGRIVKKDFGNASSLFHLLDSNNKIISYLSTRSDIIEYKAPDGTLYLGCPEEHKDKAIEDVKFYSIYSSDNKIMATDRNGNNVVDKNEVEQNEFYGVVLDIKW